MIEQKQPQNYEERFQFKLYANENIVCQRYFKINNFNENSLISTGFRNIIDLCVRMIDEDLKSKTRIYLAHIVPVILDNREELNNYLNTPRGNGWAAKSNVYTYAEELKVGSVFYIKNENKELIWNGNGFNEYDVVNNDYIDFISPIDEEIPVTFKFVLIDNDREVISKIWDGNFYPKFIRNGVDLSNKKYRGDSDVKTFDSSLLSTLISGRGDLVYNMIKIICEYCSSNTIKYVTYEKYGNKTYYNDIDKYNENITPKKYYDERNKANIEYLEQVKY